MLARLRLEHSAIRDAVLQVDDRKMTIDRLKPLKTFVPTAQEVRQSLRPDNITKANYSTGHPSDWLYRRFLQTLAKRSVYANGK